MSEESNAAQDNTDAGGEETQTFIDTLGDDYKSNDLFEGVEDAKGLATKFVETNDKVVELSKQVEEFMQDVPEKAEGYEFDIPEGLLESDIKNFEDFKSLAHELKLPNEKVQKIMAFEAERREQALADYEANKEAAKDELKKEFGDKYDARLDEVKAVLTKYGGEEMLADIDISSPEAGLLNHPSFFRFVSKVAEAMSPDSIGETNLGKDSKEEKPLYEKLYKNS